MARDLFCTACILLVYLAQPVWAHTDVTTAELQAMRATMPNLLVLDVRQPYEYCGSVGHIPGAKNDYIWDSGQSSLAGDVDQLNPTGPIVVVCASGGRSNLSATWLDNRGFENVYDLLGGMSDWSAAGYETVGCVDTDDDGLNDDLDNCPFAANAAQADVDQDGLGNPCDPDCPVLDGQAVVDMGDFAVLAYWWADGGPALAADLNTDNIVDLLDLSYLAAYWLTPCSLAQ